MRVKTMYEREGAVERAGDAARSPPPDQNLRPSHICPRLHVLSMYLHKHEEYNQDGG